jgi:glycosyltransferase involved in cell wall biosynthesis
MKKLKIAACYNLPAGGARGILRTIINGLREKGHQLDIYEEENFQIKQIKQNIIKKINILFIPLNLWRYKIFSKNLAQTINKKDYHLVIVGNSIILQHPYILRYLKIPTFLISQEPLRIVYERNLIKEFIHKRYYYGIRRKVLEITSFLSSFFKAESDYKNLRAADKLVVNSYFSKESFLAAYGILGKVIYPGVDTNIFKPNPKIKKEKIILSIGTYNGLKGHDLAIRALAILPKEKQPLLKILGFGYNKLADKEIQYLKKLRDDLGLKEKVILENNVLEETIVYYYQKAYLTLIFYFLEPFGLVPIESMACGTPIIAVKEGGLRESIKDQETGLLIERDLHEIAKNILFLLENKEVWQKFSENGPKWVKANFSLEKTIKEVEKEALELIEKRE